MWIQENTQAVRRILIHGVPAIGKSTIFSNVEGSYFLDLEDGLKDIIGIRRQPLCKHYWDVYNQLEYICDNIPPDMTTLVMDTIDWCENFIHWQIANDSNAPSIQDIGWGKGYGRVAGYWEKIRERLAYIHSRGIMLVFTCHTAIQKMSPPGMDSYDQFIPALHPSLSELIVEWCTEVLFANYEVSTRTEDLGFGKERQIAMDIAVPRMIWTQETPAVKAKNRLSMPAKIPMVWHDQGNGSDFLSKWIPMPQKSNVEGQKIIEDDRQTSQPTAANQPAGAVAPI